MYYKYRSKILFIYKYMYIHYAPDCLIVRFHAWLLICKLEIVRDIHLNQIDWCNEAAGLVKVSDHKNSCFLAINKIICTFSLKKYL